MSRPSFSGDEDAERNPQATDRDDSEQASKVEGLEIVMSTTGVKQVSTDKKTGKDKNKSTPDHPIRKGMPMRVKNWLKEGVSELLKKGKLRTKEWQFREDHPTREFARRHVLEILNCEQP